MRILIVDDVKDFRSLTRLILERNEFAVDEANDIDEAIKILEGAEAPFDLIMLDLQLDDIDTTEFIPTLKEYCSIVCCVTGNYNQNDLELATKMGANCVLNKPLSYWMLAHQVDEIIGQAG